ncbi:DNA replication factor C, large subunit [Pleurotus eryngii]|uniref:Replication factor C subunit 1 n=1 Tax=Pleurotus eryngii TaxID=5323 RepID=A0A9P5ZXH3_PLEER|nr:DNA replication factor C, large subunit [Pleurotus eryngii]
MSGKVIAKDIRNFFGPPGGQKPKQRSSQAGSSQQTLKNDPIEISTPQKSQRVHGTSEARGLVKLAAQKASDRMEVDDEDDLQPRRASGIKRRKVILLSDVDDDDDDDEVKPPPTKKQATARAPPKPATASPKSSDDEVKPPPTKKKAAARAPSKLSDDEAKLPPTKKKAAPKPRKPTAKSKDTDDELITKKAAPLAKPSATKLSTKQEVADDAPKKKSNWYAMKAAKLAGPSAPGSKQVPEAASEDCLAGLCFVFTGELSSFSRDEAIEIAKRFGGRVVGQPSSKTDFIVLGDNAGPSKLAAIKKHNLKCLSEDEFLNLIATRKGPGNGKGYDEKTKKKMEKEQADIKKAAKEIEAREKEAQKSGSSSKFGSSTNVPNIQNQLWTTRYAPQTLKEICGNKGQVEKLQQWLTDWPSSLKSGFKKPGKNGMNIFRAVLMTGPPGIGKTTSAHLCAKLAGFTPIELNASDARSKKLVENGMNINNRSLDGYLANVDGHCATNSAGVAITDRSCLIMDEVDGMSAGDRGGVGAMNALIKKTKIPIICIANDKGAQKLKPLQYTTFSLSFRKPDAAAVRSRILTIAYKEKMKVPANVVDQLVQGAQSDIRQVINMLSTWKRSSNTMDFDEGKSMVKMNEKYAILTPFDVTQKMLGPYLFSNTARETLGDKIELYFHDHSFTPLFIQENYLKTQPARVRSLQGPEQILKHLDLMDRAASSISDGDLVDALLHGPEQHWSLMPLHAVCSAVRPASFLYGQGAGYGGPNAMSFPQWLGQNSKQNKLNRQLTDVQVRMRLKVSGDKSEIRQSYLPALFPHIVRPLIDDGSAAVDKVIERMDEYYLSKEDWDTVVELGVDQNKDELVLKRIPAATKTAFTRKYNSVEHPIPFHKAFDLGKVPKKLAASGPAPDIEDAFDLDDEVAEVSDDEKEDKSADDITKDKLVRVAKKKKSAPANGGGKGRGKKAAS